VVEMIFAFDASSMPKASRGLWRAFLALGILSSLAASHTMAQMPGQFQPPPPLPHPKLPLGPDVAAPIPWWLLWCIGAVVILLMGLLVWLLLRPKPLAVVPPRQPLTSTLRALAELKARAASLPPAEVSHRVSSILRRYLQDRYAVKTVSRTTPEIFSGLRHFEPGVPIPRAEGVWKERFAPVAQLCDDLSFMPVPHSSQEAITLIENAISRVEEERV
jgi:hypothetical protein